MNQKLGRLETSISKLEEKRKTAFEGRDACTYFLLCERLGIEPEAQDLYEQGWLDAEFESDYETQLIQRNLQTTAVSKYMNFYAIGISLNKRDFRKDLEQKRSLLMKCFPRRFGKKGKQSLEKLNEFKIGSLFAKMMEYSNKRIHQ